MASRDCCYHCEPPEGRTVSADTVTWKDRLRSAIVLRGPRQRFAAWHRASTFNRAMEAYQRNPDAALDEGDRLLERLVYGWGNAAYVSETAYLRAALSATRAAEGPVLDCGSGLSTVLTGVMAQHYDNTVFSLEDQPVWAARSREVLDRFGLRAVHLDVHPLRDYGEFDWYDPDLAVMPEQFHVVLCDGPHGRTRGGRYGCLPVMRERLAPGCHIIIDDAEREAEREIARRWSEQLGVEHQVHGGAKPFIELRVPDRVGVSAVRVSAQSPGE